MSELSSAQPGQLEQFVERTSGVPDPKDTGPKGNKNRRVPFETPLSLELDGVMEEALVEFALKGVDQLEKELGRDMVMDKRWSNPADNASTTDVLQKTADSFMGRRCRYEDVYSNKVDWRPYVFGGIFKKSNLVVPLARRIARQMIARAQNYFFATDPWFTAEPEGTEDTALADKVDRYAKYKLNQIGSKKSKERAIKTAFIRGEAVVKTTHTIRDQHFRGYANVLIDAEEKPILDAKGGYILDSDKWQAETEVDPATGQPVPTNTGVEVLERDGTTPKPSVMLWRKMILPRRQIIYQGPESAPIYFKDFLCSLTAPDVQQAPICAHLYDKPVMDLVDLYVKRGLLQETEDNRDEVLKRTIKLIRELTNNTSEPKSGANQNTRPNDDESNGNIGDRGEPIAEIAEVYLWYDANGDGRLENIMLVVDRKNRVPLFYDYVANITVDGLRPFEVVRVNEVDGRWYGEGVMEMFESTQQIVDLLVNRWNVSQSESGRVIFWRPDLTIEGRANPNLEMNMGRTYTLVGNAKPEDACGIVYLDDTKFEALAEMFQFFMQTAMNESGVQHANDGEAAGLDSQKLATGIRNIEKSGQELFAPFLSDLEPALTLILKREILTLFANLDAEEIFTYLAGKTDAGKEGGVERRIERITPEEVRNLGINVNLLLTRYKGEQQLIQNKEASLVVQEFYSFPVEIQPFVANFSKQQLKAIDPRIDADELIQPGVAQFAAPAAQRTLGSGAAATGPNKPAGSPPNL